MSMRYSLFNVIVNGLTGNRFAEPAWRDATPKPDYDVIIIGGGGHGLATAYYLAKVHGIRNVAVIEKGWIGSGNAGRNTTIFRSNYLLPGNEPFYEWSMKLWEGLEQELNYNIMASQRGIVNLIHSDAQRDAYVRRGNAMRLAGADSELLDREQVRALAPFLDFENSRFPIKGGLLQARAGTARHDAVVWGYARGADRLGVDIVQNCEVTGFSRKADGTVTGVETTRGPIKAKKIALAVAGSTSRLAQKLDLRLPIESLVLQAFVSEAIKPLVPGVITFGAGHFYISQSDKGGLVFGGDLDGYNSYAQRGNLPVIEDVLEGRHVSDADARPPAPAAAMGGAVRHDHGRLADLRDRAVARPLSQRRLELRRVQGDARFGLVLRPYHRPRRAPSARRRHAARPLPHRPCHR